MTTETSALDAGNVTQSTTEPVATEATTQGNWFDSLGDDFKSNPSITKFESAEGLAKSYLGLESMLGRDKIPVPQGESDEKAWGMYRKAFGVPETYDKYEINVNENYSDFKDKLGDLSDFKELVHKHNLTPSQAQGMFDAYLGVAKTSIEAQEQQVRQSMADAQTNLQKEWGHAYDSKLKDARDVLMKLSGDQEKFEYFNEKIGNDVNFIQMLSKISDMIGEGKVGEMPNGGGFTNTPSEATREFNDILSNPSNKFYNAYRKENDLGHNEAVAHVQKLIEQMG